MKVFRCGDVVPGCSVEVDGATEAEILAVVEQHALRDHGLQLDEAASEQVRAQVRER
ncbi:DUF1059 domain-containing protein [Pseudokineococcus sp. 1T1Z-3]|uniref:DUF1059 domain-containing protein n=1 Tax=Pseudokineococcus sp. 1T1Z-3 TaxID=3132745 RepID=UPI0030B7BA76